MKHTPGEEKDLEERMTELAARPARWVKEDEELKRREVAVNAVKDISNAALEAGVVKEMIRVINEVHEIVPSKETARILNQLKED